MTHDEYIGLWKALKKKKKAGLITEDEYAALCGKLDKAYQDKKTAQDIANEIGCDPGTLATDESVLKLGKELKKVYGEASKEIQAELDAYLKKFGPEIHDLEAKFIDGTITEDELKHLKLMTLQKNILNQKADQLSGVMLNANQKAMKMINGEMLNVFAENANWQSYQLTQDTKMNLMFSVYDEHTAAKLLKDKPELLPRKEVKGQKDKAWNRKVIANAVLQGVIQGDSIPKLAKRIAVQTGETNMKAMTRYARTAMTSAQNSGRMEMLHRAKGMGIQCKKVWLATLDSRTRDAHGSLDGQKVDVDDDFQSDFGPIKFPGDLSSKGSVPANIYNCRCTLVYDYEGFQNGPTEDQRISYDEYYTEETDAKGKKHKVFHRDSKLITDMSYEEWKTAKAGNQPRADKSALQKKVDKAAGNKPAAESIRDSLANAYDYHIQKHGIRKISAEDVQKNAENGFGTGFEPDISKLDEQGQKNVASAMHKLCGEYDTPLDRIRTMTAQEAMGNSAFAFVWHNYETDSCEMVINPIKCKDTEKMVERLKHLRDKGYLPNGVTDEQLPEYIVTHEFGHTLLNMQEKLKNSRNLVGADYDVIRSARKEIETIYSEYAAEVGRIDKALKKSEMDFIMNSTEEAQRKTQDLIREMDGVRISLYSLSDIDEFVAESFAGRWFGATRSPYAKRCMDVLDKYFKR